MHLFEKVISFTQQVYTVHVQVMGQVSTLR